MLLPYCTFTFYDEEMLGMYLYGIHCYKTREDARRFLLYYKASPILYGKPKIIKCKARMRDLVAVSKDTAMFTKIKMGYSEKQGPK